MRTEGKRVIRVHPAAASPRPRCRSWAICNSHGSANLTDTLSVRQGGPRPGQHPRAMRGHFPAHLRSLMPSERVLPPGTASGTAPTRAPADHSSTADQAAAQLSRVKDRKCVWSCIPASNLVQLRAANRGRAQPRLDPGRARRVSHALLRTSRINNPEGDLYEVRECCEGGCCRGSRDRPCWLPRPQADAV